jgi:hypothetical protein
MRRDPAKAILVLDAMLEFFSGGKRWTRGRMATSDGRNRCLVGALQHIRAELGIRGDGTAELLENALPQHHPYPFYDLLKPRDLWTLRHLTYFNDRRSYRQVRAVIVKARAAAQAELAAERQRTSTVVQHQDSVAARYDSPARAHQGA